MRARVVIGWMVVVAAIAATLVTVSALRLPDTKLFADFGKQESDVARAELLRKRVYSRYRVGGPEGDLPAYLKAQGMDVDRHIVPGAENPVFGMARTEHGIGICNRQALITWRVTPTGKLKELTVSYGADNCL